MKDKKKFSIASLVVSLISIVSILIPYGSIGVAKIGIGVGILLASVGTVLGFIGKSASKKLGLAGIIIGIISFLVLSFFLYGLMIMGDFKNCVDKGNGMATCEYLDHEMEASTSYLNENQYKDGE